MATTPTTKVFWAVVSEAWQRESGILAIKPLHPGGKKKVSTLNFKQFFVQNVGAGSAAPKMVVLLLYDPYLYMLP